MAVTVWVCTQMMKRNWVPNPVIASISLGASRKFRLKHRKIKEEKLDLMLEHGSLLLMQGPTQHYWKHELPGTKKPIGPRINLTFRKIINK
jgi:alkylated DNA repair dioxygenase AlkB